MIAAKGHPDVPGASRAEKAIALALRLARAESELYDLTAGQVDAVTDSAGQTYLLRPAQESLRRNESRLRALFDGAPDVITIVSEAGDIIHQNLSVTRVLGYAVDELTGKRIFDFVHPDDLLLFCGAFSEAVRNTRFRMAFEFRHRASDGSWCALEATLASLEPVPDAGVVLILRDTSDIRRERRAASERREAGFAQALRDKDRFIAVLSHELRTPLTPASLGIELLARDERFAEARPTLAMIRRNLDLQSRLIQDMIDFATLDQQKMRLQLHPVDAHEAVRFVLEICQGEIDDARIEVLLDLEAAEKTVQADSLRIQQVMWNLVKNAVKFSSPGGRLFIKSANDSTGGLVLEFTDQGIGIEAALLPLVFDPFQQGEHSTRGTRGGLGLGMFIARGLAESQQGTLTVTSPGRDQGSTFCLTFPITPATAD